jgi:hypothetical protein
MSVSTEVQRTLVKSPPELWSELSNPEALARHLSELGEITITTVEPESKVEWEAQGASGIVHLKQSGWGTKVTLSVTREAPVVEEALETEPVAVPEPSPDATAAPESEATADPEPEVQRVAEPVAPTKDARPEPRSGFFARLFARRKASQRWTLEARPQVEPEPELEFEVLAAPEPIYPPPPPPEPLPPEPAPDLTAELASVEAQMNAETTELLTGVLDRLGAAHHRPFSRG